MSRSAKRASTALCLAAAILSASAASARTERLRWTDTSTAVDNFSLYWGLASGSYTSSLQVGVPAKDSTGAFYYDIVVNDADTIYVTVTASIAGLESARSNEIVRAGITTTTPPPPTTPPPTSATAQSAIVGFSLWNALTNTVVTQNFQSGGTIPDAIRNCASIEIHANAYLNATGPGSIKKVFDGVDNGCSSTAAHSFENSYPYAWEDDAGVGQFACAPSLSAVGNHTLTVTPYDGDNCSGLVGTPVTVSFTVSGPAPPSTTTIGAPGQPYIVP
jgi:hypothetical protein